MGLGTSVVAAVASRWLAEELSWNRLTNGLRDTDMWRQSRNDWSLQSTQTRLATRYGVTPSSLNLDIKKSLSEMEHMAAAATAG